MSLYHGGEDMDIQKALKGKWILVVDDEEDILQTICELLEMCKIDTASTFEEGKALLEKNQYHIAILDIIGRSGIRLA
jgi:DNA-binding response OmpR family regulator